MSTLSVRPRRRLQRVVPAVALSVVAGASLVRFAVLDGGGDGRSTAQAAVAPASDDGIAALEARVQAVPTDPAAWQQLGAAYVHRAVATGDPSFSGLAERAVARAEALAPGDATTLVTRGTLQLSLHQFADALASGTAALAARPDDRDALAVVVDASVETGRYDEAAAALQRLVDIRPSLAALSRVSYLRELHGDTDGAVVAMQQAVAAGGSAVDVATVTAFLGDLYWNSGRVDDAAQQYERAATLSPGLVAAEIGTARVEAARGDRDAAVARLRRLVDRAPAPAAAGLLGDLTGDHGLLRTTYALQEAAGGVVDLEAALFEADHGDPAVAVRRAQAADDARHTIATADALAWALHRAGRDAEALPHMEEARRLGTADAQLHWHAAEILAATGDTARARAEVATALATNPNFSFVFASDARALAARLA
jgi:tetratricopeptide (TPR) repeat protein